MDEEKPEQVFLQALWEGATDVMALSDQEADQPAAVLPP